MTILIYRTGPGAKSLVQCDNPNCGLEYEVLTCTCKKSKLHFCDSECKIEHQTNKKRGAYITSVKDIQYREDRGNERKDIFKQKKVKKRCTKCKRKYDGPPGNFPKNRDPNEPEPGLCPICSQRIPYDEGETAGVVSG